MKILIIIYYLLWVIDQYNAFRINKNIEIEKFNRFEFGERIRDFVIINDEILFFLEEIASIIIIKIEDLIKKYN